MKMTSISIVSAKTLSQTHIELCQTPPWWYWSAEVGACTYMIIIVAFATKAMKELLYTNNCYRIAHQKKGTSD